MVEKMRKEGFLFVRLQGLDVLLDFEKYLNYVQKKARYLLKTSDIQSICLDQLQMASFLPNLPKLRPLCWMDFSISFSFNFSDDAPIVAPWLFFPNSRRGSELGFVVIEVVALFDIVPPAFTEPHIVEMEYHKKICYKY